MLKKSLLLAIRVSGLSGKVKRPFGLSSVLFLGITIETVTINAITAIDMPTITPHLIFLCLYLLIFEGTLLEEIDIFIFYINSVTIKHTTSLTFN